MEIVRGRVKSIHFPFDKRDGESVKYHFLESRLDEILLISLFKPLKLAFFRVKSQLFIG